MTEAIEPVIGYHGSYKEVSAFSALRYEGVGGIYFTFDVDDAWDYADNGCIEEGDIPTVMTANLTIRNPVRLFGTDSQVLTIDRIADLKAQGYDAVYGIAGNDGAVYEIAVFDPEQIEVIAVETRQEPEEAATPRM